MSDVSNEFASVAGPGQVVALAFTGLGDKDTTIEALTTSTPRATGTNSSARCVLVQTPMQNLGYADVNGDIGLIAPGLIPVRKSGDGLAPSQRRDGRRRLDRLPAVRATAADFTTLQAGFVFNANNALVAQDQEAKVGADWDEPFRARRLQQFFDQIDKHSLETSAMMQADHVSLAARDFQPLLKTIQPTDERARQALALLAAWDGVMDKDKAEPLIYTSFVAALHRILIEERVGVALGDNGPFDAATLLSLINKHPAWCDQPEAKDKPDPDCRRALARAFDEGLRLLVKRDGADMSKWRWGAEHVALIKHKVFSHVPLLDRVSDLSRALERRLLYARPRRRLRGPRRHAFRAHPGRRFPWALRSFGPGQIAFHDHHRRVRPHLLPPLRRPRAAMDRRQVDPHCGDGRRAEGQGGEGAHAGAEVKSSPLPPRGRGLG